MEITINHVNNQIYNNLYLRIIPCRIDFVFSFFNLSCRICNPTRFSIGICNPAYMYQLAKHHHDNGCGGSLLLSD